MAFPDGYSKKYKKYKKGHIGYGILDTDTKKYIMILTSPIDRAYERKRGRNEDEVICNRGS